MKKYIVQKEIEYGCTIHSVINAKTGIRVNIFTDPMLAESFANKQNNHQK